MNGDFCNVELDIGKTCFLKQTILQAGEEITFTFGSFHVK